MSMAADSDALRQRRAPPEMAADEFREIGHRLVDQIAERLAAVPNGPAPDERRPRHAPQLSPPREDPPGGRGGRRMRFARHVFLIAGV